LTSHTRRKRAEEVFGADLTVDPDLQRFFDMRQVSKLETSWDIMKAGVLIVSEREDGTKVLLDGMHRHSAGVRYDPAIVFDCLVWTGLTRKQEAEMFMALNKERLAVRQYDLFKIGLIAELPWAITMNEQALHRRLKFGISPSTNTIAAVAACHRIVDKDKRKLEPGEMGLLEETLMVVEMAWGRDYSTWDNMMLQAVAALIARNRLKLDDDRLAVTLRSRSVDWWKGQAMPDHGGGSVSRSTKLARLIASKYNSRLSVSKRIK